MSEPSIGEGPPLKVNGSGGPKGEKQPLCPRFHQQVRVYIHLLEAGGVS